MENGDMAVMRLGIRRVLDCSFRIRRKRCGKQWHAENYTLSSQTKQILTYRENIFSNVRY